MATSYSERVATGAHPRPPHVSQPPPAPDPARVSPDGSAAGPSIGDLVGDISKDLSQLVHDEIELAKVELKEESAKAGKAAGMLAGAGYAGHLLMVVASFAAVFGLAHVVDLAWAALIIAGVWAVAAAVLFVTGRKRMRSVNLKPEQTMETLKEDARWARNPMS
ncbi:phage holin family protein [Streptomyces sp. NPDC051320]|uniref:phage holin family protein n=1 Tax=Streptomyces sp. NPDC051320 TaxID=3154644 RepID=UPI00343F389F